MSDFNHWFQPVAPFADVEQATPLTLCFPYAGAGAALFAPWRKQLPEDARFCAVRLPGREGRLGESPRTEIASLADELADIVAAAPVARGAAVTLIGFSLGALIAYELATRLESRGMPIRTLVAAASPAPGSKSLRGSVHQLDDDRFLKRMRDRYNAVPPQLFANAEMRRLLLPMLRGDMTMVETYQARRRDPLSCEILALAGTEDRVVKLKHVNAWRELGSSFRYRSFPGGHHFLRTHPDSVLRTILSQIKRREKTFAADAATRGNFLKTS